MYKDPFKEYIKINKNFAKLANQNKPQEVFECNIE